VRHDADPGRQDDTSTEVALPGIDRHLSAHFDDCPGYTLILENNLRNNDFQENDSLDNASRRMIS